MDKEGFVRVKRSQKHGKVTLAILVAALMAVLLGAGIAYAESESEKKYPITVTGGHAEDGDGNKVTSAARGEYLILVPDYQKGTYVTSWKVNDRTENYNGFTMPAKETKVTAIRKKQTPLTIDLTKGAQIPDVVAYYICNFYKVPVEEAVAYDSDTEEERAESGIDFDGDGTKDAFFVSVPTRNGGWTFMRPQQGASVHGDIKLPEANSNLAEWPITIRFPKGAVKASYTIKTVGGKPFLDWDTKEAITSAAPGQIFYLDYEENSKEYLVKWDAGGMSDAIIGSDSDHSCAWVIMPAGDITIQAVTGKKKPASVDLTDGYEFLDDALWDSIYDIEQWEYSGNGNVIIGDLDGDGTKDVTYGHEQRVLIPLPGSSIKGDFTLSKVNSGQYYPVTLKFGEVNETYPVRIGGGHAADMDGNLITDAEPGKILFFFRDSESGQYWKEWSSDYPGIRKDRIVWSFVMPAKEVSVKAVTVSAQTPYTIDLTEGLSEQDEAFTILINMILANQPGAFFSSDIDLDENGSVDVFFYDDYPASIIGEPKDVGRSRSYSLWKSKVIPAKDGAYGPITFTVDVEKANEFDDTISDPAEYPSIRITNGSLHDANNGDIFYDGRIKVGTQVLIYPDEVPDGLYISAWKAEGMTIQTKENNINPREGVCGVFTMPANDVVIIPQLGEKEPEPTPTPIPTPTVTKKPDPTVTTTVAPTAEPETTGKPEDRKKTEDDEEETNPLLWILLIAVPVAAAMVCIITWLALRKKKHVAASAETPETETVTEAPANDATTETPVDKENK